MKTKFIFLTVIFCIGFLTSCTPTPMNNDHTIQKAPSIYATGGEHSSEPDNEKD